MVMLNVTKIFNIKQLEGNRKISKTMTHKIQVENK